MLFSNGAVEWAAALTPKPRVTRPTHGVLGTVTHVTGSTLPFTGLRIGAAVLMALALTGLGVGAQRLAAERR